MCGPQLGARPQTNPKDARNVNEPVRNAKEQAIIDAKTASADLERQTDERRKSLLGSPLTVSEGTMTERRTRLTERRTPKRTLLGVG